MKTIKLFLLVVSFFLSSSVFAQNIPPLSDKELARYMFTLGGTNIGNTHFSDSVFTKIGDINIHISLSDKLSDYWYQKYYLERFKELGADKSDDLMFIDIKPFIFTTSLGAKEQYSDFIKQRIKGIPQYLKYEDGVMRLLNSVDETGVTHLFMLSSYNSPVYFTSYKGFLTPYLHTISTTMLSRSKTINERIFSVLQDEIAPILSKFHRALDDTIKYYGLSYTYLSANLNGDSPDAIGETISIIAPAQVVGKYAGLSITQEELFRACELYYVNSKNKEVRKISYDSLFMMAK